MTGVCGFPVINLTHPTADGWSGTRDANGACARRDPVEVVSPRLPRYDLRDPLNHSTGAGLVQTTGVEREQQTRTNKTGKSIY